MNEDKFDLYKSQCARIRCMFEELTEGDTPDRNKAMRLIDMHYRRQLEMHMMNYFHPIEFLTTPWNMCQRCNGHGEIPIGWGQEMRYGYWQPQAEFATCPDCLGAGEIYE